MTDFYENISQKDQSSEEWKPYKMEAMNRDNIIAFYEILLAKSIYITGWN